MSTTERPSEIWFDYNGDFASVTSDKPRIHDLQDLKREIKKEFPELQHQTFRVFSRQCERIVEDTRVSEIMEKFEPTSTAKSLVISIGTNPPKEVQMHLGANLKFIADYIKHSPAPPSDIARYSRVSKEQAIDQVALNCHRPPERAGIPVTLYCEEFAWLRTQWRDVVPTRDDFGTIWELITHMSKYVSTEQDRVNSWSNIMRPFFDKLLPNFSMESINLGRATCDLAITVPTPQSRALIEIDEFKRDFCSGDSDPAIQALHYYTLFWAQPEVAHLVGQIHCPSVVLVVTGPIVIVFGAVFAGRPTMDPLLPPLHLLDLPFDKDSMVEVTKAFVALRICLQKLGQFYANLSIDPHSRNPLQTQFPLPHSFNNERDSRIEFKYTERLARLVFKVDLLQDKLADNSTKTAVVKFTRKYNAFAHEMLADKGLAPPLLAVVEDVMGQGSGWKMIVMHHIDATPLFHCHGLDRAKMNDLKNQVTRAVDLLHQNGLVFGDLRNTNILVDNKSLNAMLCDFDWCGLAGIDVYPPMMNHIDITWPEGASDGLKLQFRHDHDWISNIFPGN